MDPRFDNHQFENKRKPGDFAKTAAKAGFTGNEFANGMSTLHRQGRSKRWIPEFALDASQLKSVLLHATAAYVFGPKKNRPEVIVNDLKYFHQLAVDRYARMQAIMSGTADERVSHIQQHLEAVERCGSYMALIAAVAYRAWLLHWHAPEIAAEVGLSKFGVEAILRKLLKTARELGYPTMDTSHLCNQPRGVQEDEAEILALWEQGKTTLDIRDELRCSAEKVKRVLRDHGVYVRRNIRRKPWPKQKRIRGRFA